MLELGSKTAETAPADLVRDVTEATFMAEVVDASMTVPVIVDFWAPWCGPCKTLGPQLEAEVAKAKGRVVMAKVNVDENQMIAGQLRVQSIPTVYAFVNGQPVDGFQGAIPDSQIKAFIDKLTGGQGGSTETAQLLELGEESLSLNDFGGAAQAFAHVLSIEPENEKAIAGMARVYLAGGDPEQAAQTIAMAPQDSKEPTVQSVRAQLALASKAPTGDLAGASAELEAKVAADPNDHQARFDLAEAQSAAGDFKGAVDNLLAIIQADREWNDQAARKQLLVVFEAAGATSEVARDGRRRLSSILFA